MRQVAVDVIAPRRLPSRPGIRTHSSESLHPRDVMRWDRIPVTTPARTLLDLAGVLPESLLRRAVRQAEVKRLVVEHDLRAQLARAPAGSRGGQRLAAIVAHGPVPTRSELEDRMLELLVRHGFPCPLVNVHVRGASSSLEADFLFPELRLILETDGDRYHGTKSAREADAARQADLESAGYRVVRLNWRQVTAEEGETVSRLRRIVEDQASAVGHS